MCNYRSSISRILLVSISLLTMRCGNSSLSSEVVVDPSLLQVNVTIFRSTDYEGDINGRIEAFIRDEKGRPVANRQIILKVNNRALQLNNGSSNYYGAYPYYQLNDSSLPVKADEAYTVTVVLTDGKEYPLGKIKTQAAITPVQFLPPARHARQQPLTLTWQELEPHNVLVSRWKSWWGEASRTELKISKSSQTTDAEGNVQHEQGSADEADYLTIAVGSGQGTYTIPTAYLLGPMKQFNTLDVLIASEKSVEGNKSFMKGSAVSSSRSSVYRIAITD